MLQHPYAAKIESNTKLKFSQPKIEIRTSLICQEIAQEIAADMLQDSRTHTDLVH